MQSDRRSLLKALTATGLAVSGIGWAQAATSAAGRTASAATRSAEVLAVTSSMHASALDKAFVAGVQSTSAMRCTPAFKAWTAPHSTNWASC
jgi:hypothetical protein